MEAERDEPLKKQHGREREHHKKKRHGRRNEDEGNGNNNDHQFSVPVIKQSKSSRKRSDGNKHTHENGQCDNLGIITIPQVGTENRIRRDEKPQRLRENSRGDKSASAVTSYARVVPLKRKKSIMETPVRKLNKRLVNLIAELRNSNKYYQDELKIAESSTMEKVFDLQSEIEKLSRENTKLSKQNEKLKERCRQQENKDTTLVKSKTLSKENHDLLQDLEVYKSVVCRLNKELMASQEKSLVMQRQIMNGETHTHDSSNSNILKSHETSRNSYETNLPSAGMAKPQLMIHNSRTKLYPLLQAYDEVIEEKNEIIKDHEKALIAFKAKCKDILKENEDLHEIVSQRNEKGTVSLEEWQFLHSNSLIVLEENDILHSQIELMKSKEDAMMNSHQQKSHQLKMKISALEEEKKLLQSAVTKSDSHCKKLLDQLSKLSTMIENRIPIDQHEASVLECKSLFEELKINYNSERTVLIDKLESAEKEKNRLINEIAELEATNGVLQSNLKIFEDTLATNAAQFRDVYNRMTEAIKARDETNFAIQESMQLSQQLVDDRDNVERLLQEQKKLNENLLNLRGQQIELVMALQHKIKEMENIHAAEIDKLLKKIREFETRNDGVSNEVQEKFGFMEELLNEKTKRIDHLETEKRQLKADLETVWKTTTSTMKDMTKR